MTPKSVVIAEKLFKDFMANRSVVSMEIESDKLAKGVSKNLRDLGKQAGVQLRCTYSNGVLYVGRRVERKNSVERKLISEMMWHVGDPGLFERAREYLGGDNG